MRAIKYLFIILFIQSCNKTVSTGFHFNDKNEIKGVSVNVTDSARFRYPFRIRQYDSMFLILDLHGRENYCYKLKGDSIESFASFGEGPNDFLSVENIRLNSQGTIFLLDANLSKISIYASKKDSISKQINLSTDLLRCLDFDLINDSIFVIPDYTGKSRLNIVNYEGDIIKQLFKIPTNNKKDNNISDIVLAQAWRSFIDYNPENGILAMVTQLGQVVEIYNLKTNEVVNILYGKYGEPKFQNQGAYAIPNGIMGYSDVIVGKDKIYTVFWGTSFKDIQKDPFNTREGGNIIQVFSLEGKPVKQYILDRHITGFSIDEKNNKLIGLDVNNEHQIFEYQL